MTSSPITSDVLAAGRSPDAAAELVLPTFPAREAGEGIYTAFGTERAETLGGPPSIPGYAIEQELGRGGMGVVYRAQHEQLKRPVALKVILGGEFATPEQRLRFLFEAELAARIRHPNVVQVFEAGTHQGHPFLVSELVEGGTLAARLQDRRDPLSYRAIAELVSHLAHGVQAAHAAGVIHRDLKPANVLLAVSRDAQRSGPEPKIADFGLAKAFSEKDSRLTATGMVLGTPNYMAPEQARGEKELGPAVDVYALGAILYECLCRQPPFHGFSTFDTLNQVINEEPISPRKLRPGVPVDLDVICLKALRKAPAQRYGSAAELAADLQRWLEDRPIAARPTSRWERGYRWCRRNRALAASLATLSLVVAVGLVLLAGLYWDAESQRDRAATALLRTRRVLDDMLTQDDGIAAFAERGQMTAGQRRVLEKAATYYRDFVQEYRYDPQQLAAVAKSLVKLGTLQSDLDRYAEARQTLTEAIALYRSLHGQHQPSAEDLREFGAALHNLAVQDIQQRQFTTALPLLKEAIEVQRQAVPLAPGEMGGWFYLANHWQHLGHCQRELGDLPAAIASLQECVQVGEETLRRFPEKLFPVHRQAEALGVLAELQAVQGDYSAATATLARARDLIASPRQARPDHLDLLSAAVQLDLLEARLHMGQGKLDAAMAVWRRMLPDCQRLCAEQPGIANHLENHAGVLTKLADSESERGDIPAALAHYRQAVALREKARQQAPESLQIWANLGSTLCNLGMTLGDAGQQTEGLALLNRAEGLLRGLLKAAPEHHPGRPYYWTTRMARA